MNTKPSILIGIPHRGDLIDARFDVSLLATIFDLAAAGVNVEVKKGWGRRETLDQVRNLIVKYFLDETQHTHLFFLDDDILLLRHTLEKMIARNMGILSGLYRERSQGHRPILLYTPKNTKGEMGFEFRPLEAIKGSDQHPTQYGAKNDGLVRVDVVPAGCLLITREIVENVSPPWFLFQTHHGSPVGEDVYFSLHAARAGYPCYVDTKLEALHITTHVAASPAAVKEWEHEFGFKESSTIRD